MGERIRGVGELPGFRRPERFYGMYKVKASRTTYILELPALVKLINLDPSPVLVQVSSTAGADTVKIAGGLHRYSEHICLEIYK